MKGRKLSFREDEYAKAFAKCGVGAEAARKAGYATGPAGSRGSQEGVAANRLNKRPHVQQAVAQYRAELAEKLGLTEDAILEKLSTAVQAMGPQPTAQQIQAAKLAGQYLGMWDSTNDELRDYDNLGDLDINTLKRMLAEAVDDEDSPGWH